MKTQPNFSSCAALICGLFFILPTLNAQQPEFPFGTGIDWKKVWAYYESSPTTMLRSDQVAYKLDSATGSLGRMLYEYDAEGRLVKETDYSVLNWNLPYMQRTLTYEKTPTLNKIITSTARYNSTSNSWSNTERTEEGYAPFERRWFYQSWEWDTASNTWKPMSVSEETFYPNGVRKTFVSNYWNAYTQTWITEMRVEVEVDDAGRIEKEVLFFWNYESARLELDNSEEYAYTPTGALAYTLYYSNWNFETNTWMAKDSTAYTYLPSQRETTMTRYSWNSDSFTWNFQYRVITRTDANDNEIYHLSAFYNAESQQWVNSMLAKYEYNPAGELLKLETYTWNDERSSWQGMYYEEYVLNDNGIPMFEFSYAWDPTAYDWVENEKKTFLFDSLGNSTGTILMQWNDLMSTYENILKTQIFLKYLPEPVTEIIPLKPEIETLLPMTFSVNFLYDAVTLELWDAETGSWMPFGKDNYFWSPLTPTSTKDLAVPPIFRAYPNPVYDFLTVEMDEPSGIPATGILTDLSGRLVKQVTLPATGQVDMQALPSGTYILRVLNNGKFSGALRVIKVDN